MPVSYLALTRSALALVTSQPVAYPLAYPLVDLTKIELVDKSKLRFTVPTIPEPSP